MGRRNDKTRMALRLRIEQQLCGWITNYNGIRSVTIEYQEETRNFGLRHHLSSERRPLEKSEKIPLIYNSEATSLVLSNALRFVLYSIQTSFAEIELQNRLFVHAKPKVTTISVVMRQHKHILSKFLARILVALHINQSGLAWF